MKKTTASKLLSTPSKHNSYQTLHPCLKSALENDIQISGKAERARWEFMLRSTNFKGASVTDIGANTGYFSFGAVEAGARRAIAIEGNKEHAEFLLYCARKLGLQDRLLVSNRYFDFGYEAEEFTDITFCLNVLHHIGDDFGNQKLTITAARKKISAHIRALANTTKRAWIQIGYNWKGDVLHPLFPNGTKREIKDFMRDACGSIWEIKKTAVFNPENSSYEDADERLMARFDSIGEFLNRPLFLVQRT